MALISWILVGAAVGLLAHRLLPGRTPAGVAGAVVAGVLGAVLAGVGFALACGRGLDTAGVVGLFVAVTGAVVVVGLFRMATGTVRRGIGSTRS